MKTTNEVIEFQTEQVVQAGTVVGFFVVCAVIALMAVFTSGCTRDVYVDSSMEEDVFGENYEDDTSNTPVPEDDNNEQDAYTDGDCTGPWGCKQYADVAVLPPECESDDGCADGFVCNNEGECVPMMPDPDVTENSGDTLEQQRYPLEITTEPEPEEQECHCGVGYACEDGFCVKIGGENNNPPIEEEAEPQSEDVVAQGDVVAPQPTEDVVSAFADASADKAEGDDNEEQDVTAQEDTECDCGVGYICQNGQCMPMAQPEPDVIAEVEADSAETDVVAEADVGAEVPEVVADAGVATLPFDGAVCTITCTSDYNNVRVWWAFTSADIENGAEFKIPFVQMCTWGEVAFEYNCFNGNVWGGYKTATVKCSPTEYEVTDVPPHGKVKFEKSCW